MVFDPQDGHLIGKINFFEFFSLLLILTEIICGITSPALSTTTSSLILISFLNISSSLCNVALDTTTPPIFIGFIFATGVKAPVRPIWISIFSISDTELLAENLCAIAHLGALAAYPSLFCKLKLFTLYTIPSTSNSISFLFFSKVLWFKIKFLIPLIFLLNGFILKPQNSKLFKNYNWLLIFKFFSYPYVYAIVF